MRYDTKEVNIYGKIADSTKSSVATAYIGYVGRLRALLEWFSPVGRILLH